MPPFSLLTAFSSSIHGGNPAAVVFLDLNLETDTLAGIAHNFNQPITTFVSPVPLPSKNATVAAFGIRWFTSSKEEPPICGHGTLAAAKAVFDRPDLISEGVGTIEFHNPKGGIMTARKVEGFIEIKLPATTVEEVSPNEKVKLSETLARAFGRTLAIKYVGKGVKTFGHCLLVELDEKEKLETCQVDANALRDSGCPVNIITTESSTGNELFVSRMFAPKHVPGGEDHVCGSAHCLLIPYWYKKRGIPGGRETKARQVSVRGGELKVDWDTDMDMVRLMGQVVILGRGELELPST